MHYHDTLRFVPRITSFTLGPVRAATHRLHLRALAILVGQTCVTTLVKCHPDGVLLDATSVDSFEATAMRDEAVRLASPNVAPNREMQRSAAAFRALDNALRGADYQTGPRRGQQIASHR